MVKWVRTELHGAGDDGLGGHGVEHAAVFEDDESGDVGDDVALLELLEVEDLDVGQPHGADKVGGAHDALGAPLGAVVVDDEARLLPSQVEVQLEGHSQLDVVYPAHLSSRKKGADVVRKREASKKSIHLTTSSVFGKKRNAAVLSITLGACL